MIYESFTGSWYVWTDDVPKMLVDILEDPALFSVNITGLKREVCSHE
jgi:hypothetical protein